MTQKTSFKSRMKQAFSFFRSDLRACTPLLVVFGLISAVTVVICYTICVVLGEDMTFTEVHCQVLIFSELRTQAQA